MLYCKLLSVTAQRCLAENRTHDLSIASPMLYRQRIHAIGMSRGVKSVLCVLRNDIKVLTRLASGHTGPLHHGEEEEEEEEEAIEDCY